MHPAVIHFAGVDEFRVFPKQNLLGPAHACTAAEGPAERVILHARCAVPYKGQHIVHGMTHLAVASLSGCQHSAEAIHEL
jgi:hypothetical protein